MSEEWQAYVEDPRTICKYSTKCYQKNPEHHKTYKHPPQLNKVTNKKRNRRFSPYSKNQNHDKKDTKEEGSSSIKETAKLPSDVSSGANILNKEEIDTTQCMLNLPENVTYYDADTDTQIIKQLFLVEMPSDFFEFFKFLSTEGKPVDKVLSSVNLEIIGPYDLLLGKLPVLENKELYLIHWRFFFDPPEFQAVLKRKGKSQYHIGYYRDDPKEKPVFLATNDSEKNCHITPVAENIFASVYFFLQNEKNTSPFTAMACQKLMENIKKWTEEHNISLGKFDMKKRQSQMLTKTFHSAGIVVPYNKKTQLGYRPLIETDAKIKKLFTQLEAATTTSEKDKILSEIQPVITYANIAVDECDFGTGLEVGIDLFCSGLKDLQPSALSSLITVYSLLNREAFSKIIQVHIKYRRKGANMSILSKSE